MADRAVSSASVAWTSWMRRAPVPLSASCWSNHFAWNRSRPVLLGGERLKYGVGQQVLEQARVNLTAGGPTPLFVKRLAEMPIAPQVHERVARAAIETTNMPMAVQQAEIGDAADVQHGTIFADA